MISRNENPHVYTDLSGLNAITRKGRENTPEGLKEVAKQFESLFINMVLKSMRDSTRAFAEGNYLNSNEMEFHQQNLDNQLSLHLSQDPGIGLADVLYEQMMGQFDLQESTATTTTSLAGDGQLASFMGNRTPLRAYDVVRQERPAVVPEPALVSPKAFIARLYPAAERAAERIGVDPRVLLAQSALETGWGRRMVTRADGSNSYNLFGIKADASWHGERAVVTTTEFEDGILRRGQAAFRVYDSYEESFEDYLNFLTSNPRYQQALDHAHDPRAFAQQLQDSGYATDPAYARKIARVMDSRSMHSALNESAAAQLPHGHRVN